jgi:2-polyprenyl-3-methyl-5-hydroxy-6-metoxy-1,4-benzoquinol methylase
MALEIASCPVCAGRNQRFYREVYDRFSADPPERFILQECADCSMIYLSPRPLEGDSERYYRHKDYLPFSSAAGGGSLTETVYRNMRLLNLTWKKRLMRRVVGGVYRSNRLRLLDVGCGTGEFCGMMKRTGWHAEGLERDENASVWARKEWGIPVHTGPVTSLPANMTRYDVITMWHVLEHLYEPGKAIDILRQRLAPGGTLIIALPNIAGIDARFYRRHWIALDVPRHVNHFSWRSLLRLMDGHGFRVRFSRQLPLDAFFNTLMSEQLAGRNRKPSIVRTSFGAFRAGVLSFASLAGGSVLCSHRYGATLVGAFVKKSEPV